MGGQHMKNSTLINIVLFGSIIGTLLYFFTKIMSVILISLIIISLLFYILTCIIEYRYEDLIPHEYNIFHKISEFYEWIDSKPKLIKPSKKKWRAPDNWEDNI
jgi:ABC-type bacteriocin/lantibiotic exporter with double-glycine peptidase domain